MATQMIGLFEERGYVVKQILRVLPAFFGGMSVFFAFFGVALIEMRLVLVESNAPASASQLWHEAPEVFYMFFVGAILVTPLMSLRLRSWLTGSEVRILDGLLCDPDVKRWTLGSFRASVNSRVKADHVYFWSPRTRNEVVLTLTEGPPGKKVPHADRVDEPTELRIHLRKSGSVRLSVKCGADTHFQLSNLRILMKNSLLIPDGWLDHMVSIGELFSGNPQVPANPALATRFSEPTSRHCDVKVIFDGSIVPEYDGPSAYTLGSRAAFGAVGLAVGGISDAKRRRETDETRRLQRNDRQQVRVLAHKYGWTVG